MAQDGSVVLAGTVVVSVSDPDFSVWKLDPDGALLWKFQVRVHASPALHLIYIYIYLSSTG